jgi:hypothetical protein
LFAKSIPKRAAVLWRDAIVPICQSPRIDEALLRTQRVPANDNPAPAETDIKAGPASLFKATCQTLLIFCCAIAILLL